MRRWYRKRCPACGRTVGFYRPAVGAARFVAHMHQNGLTRLSRWCNGSLGTIAEAKGVRNV